jgi:DNA invertase Pin-like site-specific DNA recombinase
VSGADPIEVRPGFGKLLDYIEGDGISLVLVEDASRFARDLVAQELGLLALGKRGVRVLTANGDDLTDTSDPARIMMRQVAGAFSEYEKRRLVHKLKVARDRVKALTGKCGGRRPMAEIRPEVVALVKELHAQRMSLREISADLADRGHLTANGKPYAFSAVAKMLKREGLIPRVRKRRLALVR